MRISVSKTSKPFTVMLLTEVGYRWMGMPGFAYEARDNGRSFATRAHAVKASKEWVAHHRATSALYPRGFGVVITERIS